jgi:hypothetical protein
MSVYVTVGGLIVWSIILIAWAVWKNQTEPENERTWDTGGMSDGD